MATARKTLERRELDGVDVTVLHRGVRNSTIRDQYGYVREVRNNQLKRINDPNRQYVVIQPGDE